MRTFLALIFCIFSGLWLCLLPAVTNPKYQITITNSELVYVVDSTPFYSQEGYLRGTLDQNNTYQWYWIDENGNAARWGLNNAINATFNKLYLTKTLEEN